MTDPVSPREALVERLLMKAAHDENYWDQGECVALLREAADALAADEALRAENGNLQAQYEVARVVATEFVAERDTALAAVERVRAALDERTRRGHLYISVREALAALGAPLDTKEAQR